MTNLQQRDAIIAHNGYYEETLTHKKKKTEGQTRTAHTDNFQEQHTLKLGPKPMFHT